MIGLGVMGLMHGLVARSRGVRVAGSQTFCNLAASSHRRSAFGRYIPTRVYRYRRRHLRSGFPGSIARCVCGSRSRRTVVMFTPLEPGVPFTLDPNDLYFAT